jgi:WD40 repeat protein
MACCAPHIYLSALPFAPSPSSVSRIYRDKFPNLLVVTEGESDRWPSLQLVIRAHRDFVHSVAFSPDGSRIISGSGDSTIKI